MYVEGNTELIFVRELLIKWFNYDAQLVGIRCYALRNVDPPGIPVDYNYGSNSSDNFYEIVNVGTDVSVLSKAIENAQRHRNAGFDRIIALRDMFSDKYHEASYKKCCSRAIFSDINEKFIQGAIKSINEKGCSDILRMNFAIMEVEAWFLGMGWYLEREDTCLSCEYLRLQFGLDLNDDPEVSTYHPANELDMIYAHVGKVYGKHENNVNAIMGKLYREDFIKLCESSKCESFRKLLVNLLPSC